MIPMLMLERCCLCEHFKYETFLSPSPLCLYPQPGGDVQVSVSTDTHLMLHSIILNSAPSLTPYHY